MYGTSTLSALVVPAPSGLFFGVLENAITNQGLNTRVNGAIGTTAASSLVTGFTDTMASPLKYTPLLLLIMG
jgi:hypothetical protein